MQAALRTMGDPPLAAPKPTDSQSARLQPFACLNCRQRKVKCDRRDPCSNCVKKAADECSFVAPVRGRRTRTKPVKEGLHAKLKRLEQLLGSHGAKIEPGASEPGCSDFDSVSQTYAHMVDNEAMPRRLGAHGSFVQEDATPKLIRNDGAPRYVYNSPWTNIVGEDGFPEYPTESAGINSVDQPGTDGLDLLLNPNERHDDTCRRPDQILAHLHPPHNVLLELWEIYVDRVDPFVKVLHLPSFWTSITNAIRKPQSVSKSCVALICSFYLAIIHTLEEDECLRLLGAQKPVLFKRYNVAAIQALTAVQYMSTSRPMTLCAYVIYLMGVRSMHAANTFYILSGVALRLACKMGLHRDGASLGFSPFDTEMRRRLWWSIVQIEGRAASLLGVNLSLDLFSGDTKPPLNIHDEDITPDMADFPPEGTRITPLTICLIRCELATFLRQASSVGAGAGHNVSDSIVDMHISIEQRNSLIKELEGTLENRFLRYCDPANTLDTFVSMMVRGSVCVCKIKLSTHNIRRCTDRGITVPQSERDIVFANSIKILEYLKLSQQNASLRKYQYQGGTSFLWTALLWVLIEIRHRKVGPQVDRVWELIGSVLSYFPLVFQRETSTVYTVLGRWTIEAWDDYVAASRREERPQQPVPEWITTIRKARIPYTNSPVGKDRMSLGSTAGNESWDFNDEDLASDGDSLGCYSFPDLFNFELNPAAWDQWESLTAFEDTGGI